MKDMSPPFGVHHNVDYSIYNEKDMGLSPTRAVNGSREKNVFVQ